MQLSVAKHYVQFTHVLFKYIISIICTFKVICHKGSWDVGLVLYYNQQPITLLRSGCHVSVVIQALSLET